MKLNFLSLTIAICFCFSSCKKAKNSEYIGHWKFHDYYSSFSDRPIPDHEKEKFDRLMEEEKAKMSFYELELKQDQTYTFMEPNSYSRKTPMVSEGSYEISKGRIHLIPHRRYFVNRNNKIKEFNDTIKRTFLIDKINQTTAEITYHYKKWENGIWLRKSKESGFSVFLKE